MHNYKVCKNTKSKIYPRDRHWSRRRSPRPRNTEGLLFKIIPCGRDDYETVLCILTSKAHILMDMYHSSIIALLEVILA